MSRIGNRKKWIGALVGLSLIATGCAQSEDAVEPSDEEAKAVAIEPPENDCAKADPGDPDCE